MVDRLCFSSGSNTTFNVKLDIKNIGWMLQNEFELDLISTNPNQLREDLPSYFNIHGGKYSQNRIGEAKAIHAYLQNHDPITLVNVIEPTLHGSICGPLARIHSIPFTYRYSGDLFNLYRVSSSWKKPAYFTLHNVLGQVGLKFVDRAIALGPTGRSRLVDQGIPKSDIAILPPPIDKSRFQKKVDRPDIDIPEDRSIILFVGRWSEIKGARDLRDAIPEILSRRDDLHFVLVGVGDVSLGIPVEYHDHLTVISSVPPVNMPQYFQMADLLILPSLIEGLPRVILEALASDTPVLSRDVADTSYATANLFDEKQEFIDMVIDFESLSLDDVTPFTRETLKPQYLEFFKGFS